MNSFPTLFISHRIVNTTQSSVNHHVLITEVFVVILYKSVIWDISTFFKEEILLNNRSKISFKSISKVLAVLHILKSQSEGHEEMARFICLSFVNYSSPDSQLYDSQLATEWKEMSHPLKMGAIELCD